MTHASLDGTTKWSNEESIQEQARAFSVVAVKSFERTNYPLALQAASLDTSTSTTARIQASYAIVTDFFNGLLVV